MKKIGIIVQREYLTRVKKKSFIIFTFLMPLVVGVIALLPAYLASLDDKKERVIAVHDQTGIFLGNLEESEYTKFYYIPKERYQEVRNNLKESEFYALLIIPSGILHTNIAHLTSTKNITIDVKSRVKNSIKAIIEEKKRKPILEQAAIPDLEKKLEATQTDINIKTIKLDDSGKVQKSSTEVAIVVGYIFGFLIYIFILMYGQTVMRGVMEEKQSRIVEVIVSSVKPFELMMGKIVGIALVGLTQFSIWVALFAVIITVGKDLTVDSMSSVGITQGYSVEGIDLADKAGVATEIFSLVNTVNFPLIIGCFIFFFIGGYFFYSSLLAAVGSAIDTEEDAQQFTIPVIMPLVLAVIVMVNVITNPEGPLAFWFSIVPFTSPVVMMVRVSYGVPVWELILSMITLVVAFVTCVWIAGKVYRTGILMYGKSASWKELFKWLTYRY